MSLIDEALKRARQEAALQDAAQREAQFRRVPVYTTAPPARSRSGLTMAAVGICVGLVLALGLAFAAGWLPAGRSEEPAREELRAEATEAEAPVAAPRIIEEEPAPVAAPSDRTDPTDRTDPSDPIAAPPQAPAPVPTPVIVEPRPLPRQEAPPPVPQAPAAPEPAPVEAAPAEEAPAPVPAEPTAPATPAAAPAAPPVSFVRQVPVPGGGTLELSGIAFSAERPVALINGKTWVPGEAVQGYTIVAIEPGRVQLDGHGQTVFVSLK